MIIFRGEDTHLEVYDFLFLFGGWGLNPEPCIYYALSLSTELNSR